jgi:hypothetical protein
MRNETQKAYDKSVACHKELTHTLYIVILQNGIIQCSGLEMGLQKSGHCYFAIFALTTTPRVNMAVFCHFNSYYHQITT